MTKNPIPAILLVACVIPMIGGGLRIIEFVEGAEVTVANARFFNSPVPVVLHIASSAVFSILGAFQVGLTLQGSRWRWHRQSGRLLLPTGYIVVLTGLWMTLYYPAGPLDSPSLYWVRLLVSAGMTLALVKGSWAIGQRDFASHGRWMLRSYGLGMGAATQAVIAIPLLIFIGEPEGFYRTIMLTSGWIINVMLVEWIILKRNKKVPPQRRVLQQK